MHHTEREREREREGGGGADCNNERYGLNSPLMYVHSSNVCDVFDQMLPFRITFLYVPESFRQASLAATSYSCFPAYESAMETPRTKSQNQDSFCVCICGIDSQEARLAA